jgi:hypothetical protein
MNATIKTATLLVFVMAIVGCNNDDTAIKAATAEISHQQDLDKVKQVEEVILNADKQQRETIDHELQ